MEITIVIDIGERKGLTCVIDEEGMGLAKEMDEDKIKTVIRTTVKHMTESIMEGMEYVPK